MPAAAPAGFGHPLELCGTGTLACVQRSSVGGKRRYLFFIVLILTLAASSVFAQNTSPAAAPAAPQEKQETPPGEKAPAKSAEKHSSPEDRQRLVTVARKLEAAPLDTALGPDRAWAMQWIVAAPDVPVRICTTLLTDLRRPRYKYRSQMADQLLLSSAADVIEHPEHAKDIPAQNTAGMEGVLKAYTAILKTDPQATAKPLDDYLQKQKEGKLAATVAELVKGCQ
jgi:hypothetical protein